MINLEYLASSIQIHESVRVSNAARHVSHRLESN